MSDLNQEPINNNNNNQDDEDSLDFSLLRLNSFKHTNQRPPCTTCGCTGCLGPTTTTTTTTTNPMKHPSPENPTKNSSPKHKKLFHEPQQQEEETFSNSNLETESMCDLNQEANNNNHTSSNNQEDEDSLEFSLLRLSSFKHTNRRPPCTACGCTGCTGPTTTTTATTTTNPMKHPSPENPTKNSSPQHKKLFHEPQQQQQETFSNSSLETMCGLNQEPKNNNSNNQEDEDSLEFSLLRLSSFKHTNRRPPRTTCGCIGCTGPTTTTTTTTNPMKHPSPGFPTKNSSPIHKKLFHEPQQQQQEETFSNYNLSGLTKVTLPFLTGLSVPTQTHSFPVLPCCISDPFTPPLDSLNPPQSPPENAKMMGGNVVTPSSSSAAKGSSSALPHFPPALRRTLSDPIPSSPAFAFSPIKNNQEGQVETKERDWSEAANDDVLRLLILYLPLRDALRFKSQCRSIYELYSDPCFREAIRKKNHQIQSLLAMNGEVESYDLTCLRHHETIKPPINNENSLIHLVGGWRGLLCLYDGDAENESFYVWNPTTRRHLKIPKCNILTGYLVGFSEDEPVQELPVLFASDLLFTKCFDWRGWTWSEVDAIPDIWRAGNVKKCVGVFAGGNLYWSAGLSAAIIGFSIRYKLFFEVDMPMWVPENQECSIAALHKSLLICANDGEGNFRFSVREDERWKELFIFRPILPQSVPEEDLQIVLFGSVGERLFMGLNSSDVAILNMDTHEVHNWLKDRDFRCGVIYVRSHIRPEILKDLYGAYGEQI